MDPRTAWSVHRLVCAPLGLYTARCELLRIFFLFFICPGAVRSWCGPGAVLVRCGSKFHFSCVKFLYFPHPYNPCSGVWKIFRSDLTGVIPLVLTVYLWNNRRYIRILFGTFNIISFMISAYLWFKCRFVRNDILESNTFLF